MALFAFPGAFLNFLSSRLWIGGPLFGKQKQSRSFRRPRRVPFISTICKRILLRYVIAKLVAELDFRSLENLRRVLLSGFHRRVYKARRDCRVDESKGSGNPWQCGTRLADTGWAWGEKRIKFVSSEEALARKALKECKTKWYVSSVTRNRVPLGQPNFDFLKGPSVPFRDAWNFFTKCSLWSFKSGVVRGYYSRQRFRVILWKRTFTENFNPRIYVTREP